MGELPGKKLKDITPSSDYKTLSSDIYSTIQESTRHGLRARKGAFSLNQLNSPRFRIAYYRDDHEAVFEIDDWVNASLERHTVFHFREDGGPVSITGYVDYDLTGKKRTLYYLNQNDCKDEIEFDDSEEWVRATVASAGDLQIIQKLIENPLANAALLAQLPLLKS